jgi:UDP-N-acetylglucosamine 2-epimerase
MSCRYFVVIGSRPEAIKLAPVIETLRRDAAEAVIVCSTGQQRDMIPQALAEFDLAADLNLDVMQPDQTLAALTARLGTALDQAMAAVRPHVVLVQGDTTSAMVGALTAFYRRIPVGHVEAGMRTQDIYSPFPEEVNRRIVTQCATWHFAATDGCRRNLLQEGVSGERITVTGNTVVDALFWTRARLGMLAQSTLPARLLDAIEGRRLVLVTTHRRENFGEPLAEICEAIRALVQERDDVVAALPVHPNPRVRATVERVLGAVDRVVLLTPQPYRSFVELMERCDLVLTDSGGLQEEAPSFRKPVLILRDTTERPEGVQAGCARLVGTRRDRILHVCRQLLDNPMTYHAMTGAPHLYGDGNAAARIAAVLRASDVGRANHLQLAAAASEPGPSFHAER